MSLELISLFAVSVLVAISGQVFGAGLATFAAMILMVLFAVMLSFRGLKKPVV